jgi:hypothetical protein
MAHEPNTGEPCDTLKMASETIEIYEAGIRSLGKRTAWFIRQLRIQNDSL